MGLGPENGKCFGEGLRVVISERPSLGRCDLPEEPQSVRPKGSSVREQLMVE